MTALRFLTISIIALIFVPAIHAITKYTSNHEWISFADGIGTVGITKYLQSQMGDIIHVETSQVGTQIKKQGKIGDIESVLTPYDFLSPVSGEIVAINSEVIEDPDLINSDAEGEGWIVKIKLNDLNEFYDLLNEPANS